MMKIKKDKRMIMDQIILGLKIKICSFRSIIFLMTYVLSRGSKNKISLPRLISLFWMNNLFRHNHNTFISSIEEPSMKNNSLKDRIRWYNSKMKIYSWILKEKYRKIN